MLAKTMLSTPRQAPQPTAQQKDAQTVDDQLDTDKADDATTNDTK